MVDEQPPADLGAGVDFNAGFLPAALGNPPGQKLQVVPVAPVRLPVGAHRLKPRVEEKHLQPGTGGGVPLHHRVQVLL